MAGGGQIRPMGGAMPMSAGGGIPGVDFPRRGEEGSFYGQQAGARDPSVLAGGRKPMPSPPGQNAQGNLSPMGGAMPMSAGGVAGVDFPRRGEEGSFYGQQANARIPQNMGGTGQMYADPRGPVRRPGPMNDNSPESLAISNSYNQSLNQASPLAPQGFNVNQAAAGGLQKAFQGTEAAMQAPNIGQFMNPYTKQVTQNTLADLERQRQMQMNTLGAQASGARAFGGSRHGVAEALTNEAFARQGAQAFGNLQQSRVQHSTASSSSTTGQTNGWRSSTWSTWSASVWYRPSNTTTTSSTRSATARHTASTH